MSTQRTHRAPAGTVLIVEDQPAVARALMLLLDIHGIDAEMVSSADDAVRAVGRGDVDVVLQDMNFTPGATSGDEGMALFRRLRQIDAGIPIVLLTAWTSLEAAVQMVKEGATDYLAKPWNDEKLLAIVTALLESRRRDRERRGSRAALARSFDLRGIVYESAAMHRVVTLALQVAAADVPVLITGPNGAGKEKIAEIIQANSGRRKMAFVKVNAGALPDTLLESELFGAEAGAFTGAARLRVGRFESANGGTLFLDEIGNLSPAGQAKILRVLQNGEYERLGSSETRRADVRLLCATNADLHDAVRRGAFRQDLLFRLNVIEIHVPPLRDRKDDVLPLADSFLRKKSKRLSDEAREALLAHDWPGNVRELENRLQRALVTAAGDTITADDLGLGERSPIAISDEKQQIGELLRRFHGSVSRAAKSLGLSRQALYRKMERLGIVLERRPKE
ncbi:MAG TPA: sigma-54 dependent transcriptional regulator [Thermoanaerobaculia bacterium]|nr:sigma-54 dependent transcriptional regulator [Thermoanaerobaculia bacterium]